VKTDLEFWRAAFWEYVDDRQGDQEIAAKPCKHQLEKELIYG
jgi:hypothetical protein